MSFFRYLCSCCPGSASTSQGGQGESQPLLPGDGVPNYVARDTASANRERVRERLSNIVRSKEGKMVNITDHLPFNLHNRDVNGASSSRLRAESPSPHPSVATGDSSASRSGSSFRPGAGRSGISKEPALSVRLIRGRDSHLRGGTSRGRLGRFGEERGVEYIQHNGGQIDDNVELAETNGFDTAALDENGIAPEILPLDDADKDAIIALSSQIGKQLKDGWKIEDAGPISRGWGD